MSLRQWIVSVMVLAIVGMGVSMGLSGCKEETPAMPNSEQMKEATDAAAGEAVEAAEEADKAAEAADDAADEAESAADDADAAAEEAKEAAEEAVEQAH